MLHEPLLRGLISWPTLRSVNEETAGHYVNDGDTGEFRLGSAKNMPRLSVTLDEARILAALAAGKSVLEIGTGLGVSTAALASQAKVVETVDPDPWVMANVVFDPRLPILRHVSMDPVLRSTMGYDMAFIDGNHDAEAVAQDISVVRELLNPWGMIVFHDMKLPTVQSGIAMADLHDVFTLHTFCGIGLWVNECS